MVDGANRFQAFTKIILPMLLPCVVATGAYIFMTSWNEYTFAVMFTNERNRTIPVALKNFIGQLGVEWGMLTAGGVITIIPVCIMFSLLKKTSRRLNCRRSERVIKEYSKWMNFCWNKRRKL